jgi:hypothetical protein
MSLNFDRHDNGYYISENSFRLAEPARAQAHAMTLAAPLSTASPPGAKSTDDIAQTAATPERKLPEQMGERVEKNAEFAGEQPATMVQPQPARTDAASALTRADDPAPLRTDGTMAAVLPERVASSASGRRTEGGEAGERKNSPALAQEGYATDAQILGDAMQADYLARNYEQAGDLKKAAEFYVKRAELVH